MSELLDNARKRKDLLKHMILQLHEGKAPEEVKKQLIRLLGKVPYGDVVEVEQELIAEGMPQMEILKLCDIHTEALKGVLEEEKKVVPAGHPVHTFREENRAIEIVLNSVDELFGTIVTEKDSEELTQKFFQLRGYFNSLLDVEKHYQRKENLLFPFMEKHGITGPSSVMWGKHDEVREMLKNSLESLEAVQEITPEEAALLIETILKPTTEAINEMIYKEEEILFPMSLDTLSIQEWYDIYRQSDELGYCLYDPKEEWQPEGVTEPEREKEVDKIQLSSGSFSVEELNAILNTIPFDLTFVDKDDKVRYFSQGRERIFARSRAILGRNVQRCHPPSSVHIVQKILDDFRAGRQDRAAFWINLKGKFIMIEYFALRNRDGEYMGTLEVSQDLTEKRALQGEQRLLKYKTEGKES